MVDRGEGVGEEEEAQPLPKKAEKALVSSKAADMVFDPNHSKRVGNVHVPTHVQLMQPQSSRLACGASDQGRFLLSGNPACVLIAVCALQTCAIAHLHPASMHDSPSAPCKHARQPIVHMGPLDLSRRSADGNFEHIGLPAPLSAH